MDVNPALVHCIRSSSTTRVRCEAALAVPLPNTVPAARRTTTPTMRRTRGIGDSLTLQVLRSATSRLIHAGTSSGLKWRNSHYLAAKKCAKAGDGLDGRLRCGGLIQ